MVGAIDHGSGEVIAFWFGTREHKHLDELLELLKPLTRGKVYTEGTYAYYERFSSEVVIVTKKYPKDRKKPSVSERTWSARLVRSFWEEYVCSNNFGTLPDSTGRD
jgi:IS1 family transposase